MAGREYSTHCQAAQPLLFLKISVLIKIELYFSLIHIDEFSSASRII